MIKKSLWLWENVFIKHFKIIFLTNLVSATQLFLTIILSRRLSVSDFGILNSILSTQIVCIFSLVPLSFFTTKGVIYFSDSQIERQKFLKFIYTLILLLNILSLLLYFIFKNLFINFLRLDLKYNVNFTFYVFGFLNFSTIFYIYLTGIFQGIEKFIELAYSSIAKILSLFFLCVISVYVFRKSYNWILLSYLLSNIFSIIWMNRVIKKINPELFLFKIVSWQNFTIGFRKYKNILKQWIPISLSILTYLFFTTSDLFFVKHFFSEFDTGIYSAMSLLSKIILYLSAALVQIIYSRISINHKESKDSFVDLLISFITNITVNLPFIIVVLLFPEFIIKIILGSKFASGVTLLKILTLGMGVFSLLNILINYFMAKERFNFLYVVYFYIALLIISLYSKFNSKPIDLAYLYFFSFIIVLISLTLPIIYINRSYFFELIFKKNNTK